jgi:hypothetical protein
MRALQRNFDYQLRLGGRFRERISIDQAWNADQSLLVLDRGTTPKVFVDGRTYRPLMALQNPIAAYLAEFQ